MKQIMIIVSCALTLLSCASNVTKPTTLINAPELKGLGELAIGMTMREAESTIKSNNATAGYPFYSIREQTSILNSDIEEYKEKKAFYIMSDGTKLSLTIDFYNDTLMLIRLDSNDAEIMRNALKEKYNDGHLQGRENDYIGLKESWVSENVRAVYFLRYKEGVFFRTEYMEISSVNFDIKKKLAERKEEIRLRQETQRKEALRKL